MTLEDFSPDKLAVLEAKLRADLETVQKMRALMLEHLGGRDFGTGRCPSARGATTRQKS